MKKKTALVLHGFPGLAPHGPLKSYIAQIDCDVIAPDLFGSGYQFSKEGILKMIEEKLLGRKPDFILAFSLGGLIAPFVASEYPDAKLVLIATGPRINLGIKPLNYLIKKFDTKYFGYIYRIFSRLSFWLFRVLHVVFGGSNASKDREVIYEQNVIDTYAMLKTLKMDKLLEVLKFARETDNTELLKTLKNQTLVITGGRDVLMPYKLSMEMASHIKNCQIIENKDRLHYEVFDERDFDKINDFLGI